MLTKSLLKDPLGLRYIAVRGGIFAPRAALFYAIAYLLGARTGEGAIGGNAASFLTSF